MSARIADYEMRINGLVGENAGRQLCQLIKQTSPNIYKDQLAGVIQIMQKLTPVDERLIARVIDRPRLTATQLKEYVEVFTKDALERVTDHPKGATHVRPKGATGNAVFGLQTG